MSSSTKKELLTCFLGKEATKGGCRWRSWRRVSQGKDSGAKDLSGASSISGLPFFRRLTRKKVALGCVGEEEVGSGSGGDTQERVGAEKE